MCCYQGLLVMSIFLMQLALGSRELVELGARVECGNVLADFCPTPGTPPSASFTDGAGTVTGETLPCCKADYLQCQIQQRDTLCRTLFTYTIEDSSNAEAVCPPTSPDCTCQESFGVEKGMSMRFCPSNNECCPVCECHGDPHCTAFDRSVGFSQWAVCDDRTATCVHAEESCATTKYAGKQCRWENNGFGAMECLRALDSPEPLMNMYTKTYRNYWDPSDNTNYLFTLDLGLSTYGAIGDIILEDAGVTNRFLISDSGRCVDTPSYPMKGSKVTISDLPSGVQLQLTCVNNGPARPQRWDITYLRDPWFPKGDLQPQFPGQEFSGYCATGVIAEDQRESLGGCRVMDVQIARHYGCRPNKDMDSCKADFCKKRGKRLSFPLLTGTGAEKCFAYVASKKPEDEQNFLKAACSLAMLEKNADNPDLCEQDDDCRRCMNDVVDFPDDIAAILHNKPEKVTPPPTSSCPRDLLAVGLGRPSLGVFGSGVEIDAFNAVTNTWEPIFSLTDSEILSCKLCVNALFVNGTSPANQLLMRAGTYRMRQCTGLNDNPNQDLCTGAVGYNSTLTYLNPQVGGTVSTPLGMLYSSDDLVCNPKKYPKCPDNYGCCVWDKATQLTAWKSCMEAYPGGAAAFPHCQA